MKRHTRLYIYILLLIVAVLVIASSIKPIIIFFAKRQFENIFVASSVSIGSCTLKPISQLSLSDIVIKRDKIYDFKINEMGVYYDPFLMIKRSLAKFSLKGVYIKVNLPQENISELRRYLNLGSPCSSGSTPIFLVRSLGLSNVNLDITSKDLIIKTKLSLQLDLIKQLVDYCDLTIGSLSSRGAQLQDATLKFEQGIGAGYVYIKQIKYNKATIREIKSNVRLEDKNLFLDSISAQTLGGQIQGKLSFKIDKTKECSANLKFINLDMDSLAKDFNLTNKFQMSGMLAGAIVLRGRGTKINTLSGNFYFLEPGGNLNIIDNKFLENLADSSEQPLNILVESVKNYYYNKGVMHLFLNKDDLVLAVALEGKTGKRNLNITIHDFKLPRFVR